MKISPDAAIDNLRRLNPSVHAADRGTTPVDLALLARIVAQPRQEIPRDLPDPDRHRWRVPLAAMATVGAVIALLLLVLAPWSNAPTATAASWRLVNLNGAQFRDLGTVEGYPQLQCVTNRVCYAPGYGPTSLVRSTIYRTADGGAHWSPSAPVPQAVESHTPSLECSTASFCFFRVGTSEGIVVTTSGGKSWTSLPLPATPPGETNGVWCANSLRCLVSQSSLGAVDSFAVTSDGGGHWSTRPAPTETGDPWYLTCDSSGSCLQVELDPDSNSLTAITSGSWGGPWVAHAPQSIGRVAILHTSCADASHCMFVGLNSGYEIITTSNAGRTWSVSRPPHGWQNIATAVGCSDVERCWVATASYDTNSPDGAYSHPKIEATSDLGRTWKAESIANTRPTTADVLTLSCPPSGDGCIGLGNGKDHFVPPANRRALSNPTILSNLPDR